MPATSAVSTSPVPFGTETSTPSTVSVTRSAATGCDGFGSVALTRPHIWPGRAKPSRAKSGRGPSLPHPGGDADPPPSLPILRSAGASIRANSATIRPQPSSSDRSLLKEAPSRVGLRQEVRSMVREVLRDRREDALERRLGERAAAAVEVRDELVAELVDVASDCHRGRVAERAQALAVDAVADRQQQVELA